MATTDIYYKKWVEWNLEDAATQVQVAAKINESAFVLTQKSVTPSLTGYPAGFSLSAAQTGSADSTHTFDFGNKAKPRDPVLVRFVTTIGSTPTCTYTIKGSVDNTTFFSLAYSDSATPSSFSSGTFSTTTAATKLKIVQPGQVYRYLKVTYSSNTNVTNTADAFALGD